MCNGRVVGLFTNSVTEISIPDFMVKMSLISHFNHIFLFIFHFYNWRIAESRQLKTAAILAVKSRFVSLGVAPS